MNPQDNKVSWEALAAHSIQEDLWILIDGRVYDVTTYLAEHPGGDEVLIKNGGLDASESFKKAVHSDYAVSLRDARLVGVIESEERPEWYEKQVKQNRQKSRAPINPEQLLNWTEVVKHNNKKDLWIVIEGKVYDVTDFQDEHPGGPAQLIGQIGKDATKAFEDIRHSQDAKNMLKNMQVGVVMGQPPKTTVESSSPLSKVVFLIIGVLIGILYKLYFRKEK